MIVGGLIEIMFLYDYEKTLFIVDSMTAAFMISIMTNNRPAKVIFEHKREIMNEDSFEKIKAFSYKAIRIISAQEYSVPHPFFFFENGFLKAMDNLRKFSFDMRKSGFREDDSQRPLSGRERKLQGDAKEASFSLHI